MRPPLDAGFEYLDDSPPIQPGADPCDEAIDFLEQLRPGGPWVLSAIVPDGPIDTITALARSDVRAFVRGTMETEIYILASTLRGKY
jgi:hypothetical protein